MQQEKTAKVPEVASVVAGGPQVAQAPEVAQAPQATAKEKSRARVLRGAVFVVIAGILWGFSGTCGQLLSQDFGVPVQWVVSQRLMYSGVLLLAGGLLFNRKNMGVLLRERRNRLHLLAYAALGIVCCGWFYLEAIAWTNAGTGTLMEQLSLILILFVVCVQERRVPHALESVALVLALVGVFLVSTHGDPTTLVLEPAGLVWGIAAAVGAAFYVLLPVPLLKEHGSFTVTAPAMALAGLIALPAFRPWTIEVAVTPEIALATAGMTLCGTILAYLFFMQGVRDAGPVLAGLLNTVELLSAFVISHFWLGTPVGFWDVAGGMCIMAMMVLLALRGKK